jgi:hypothetical protein
VAQLDADRLDDLLRVDRLTGAPAYDEHGLDVG